MKKIIKIALKNISRIIYNLVPDEFKSKKRNDLLETIYEHSTNETFKNFKDHFKKSVLFKDDSDDLAIREYAIRNALLKDKNSEFFYLEFGTFKGKSANFFSQYVKKFYTFDSFEGLSSDWVGNFDSPKGYFNLKKKIPKLNSNAEVIEGLVEDTLDDFLNTHKPKINFIHFDMDTYEPTKFALTKVKPYLLKNSILIFDNFYNYFGWDQGEYKAFTELFDKSEFEYRAFSLYRKRCVVQLK